MKIPEILVVEVDRRPGSLARVLQVVGEAGLSVDSLEVIHRTQDKTTWELTLEMDEDTDQSIFARIDALPVATLVGISDRVFNLHKGGKIKTVSKVPLSTPQLLRDLYTPGVARVCLAIHEEPELVWEYTNLGDTVAIVTNGSAVLGLGDIGPQAGLPVMEGKAALFHTLAGISGVPLLIDSHDPRVMVETLCAVASSFGAIQLEDIAAPACFEVERALRERLPIPVLHDDQHGTAVVVLAALLRATGMVERELCDCTVGQVGLGAAGIGIARLLLEYGVSRLLGTDTDPIALRRLEDLGGERATLEEVMATCDVVVATTGVRGLIPPALVQPGQLILSLTNPDPEIEPDAALQAGAVFAADGKSINNVSAFPGLFRGALDARAAAFTDAMLFAAARCLAAHADEGQLVPDPLDKRVHEAVAQAVAAAAQDQ